jgi:hypothetical protein
MEAETMKKNIDIIALYMDLAGAIITETADGWTLSTPEERITYTSKAELIADIQYDLHYIREAYERHGEIDEYKAAERRAWIY